MLNRSPEQQRLPGRSFQHVVAGSADELAAVERSTHAYHEAACQLAFMGFLHRVVNGGGYIDRLGLDTGTLIIFDRRPEAPAVHERTGITETSTASSRKITLVRA